MIQNKSSRKISKFILRDDFNIRCILFLFQTNVNRIHPFYSTLKIKRNNIPFFDLRNNVIHMEEIFFYSGKIFDKPKSSGLIKKLNSSSQNNQIGRASCRERVCQYV